MRLGAKVGVLLRKRRMREIVTGLSTGGNPAAWASSPAPGGCRWDFVTFNGALVTRSGEPVVSLVRIN